jgi:hypothetical protein
MSLYFIDMEYCQATLEDVIKILHRDDRKTQPVSGNPKKSFEREFTCLGNQTSLPHEEVPSFLNAINSLLTGSPILKTLKVLNMRGT